MNNDIWGAPMDVATLAACILAANDARLEGRISRTEHAGLIATFQIDIDEAGITWADIDRHIAAGA